jgi:hypothetical protein
MYPRGRSWCGSLMQGSGCRGVQALGGTGEVRLPREAIAPIVG